MQGERLWFKAYVQDQKSKQPSANTSNLYVGIYTPTGDEVKRKLLYVENGMAQGDFAIDSSFHESDYVVLAWTNYMRNFKELEPFQQRIKIFQGKRQHETGKRDVKISIYPEGGQLIAGAYNNIGILVDDGFGQGVPSDNLELIDGDDNVVKRNIATNSFGFGKTIFKVEKDKAYYLQKRGNDGTITRVKLPKQISGELGISIDNRPEEKVALTVIGSETTFKLKNGQNYTLAYYQDDFIEFKNFEVDQSKMVLYLERDWMPQGLITVVLFNGNLSPVAHRIFFNHLEGRRTSKRLSIESRLNLLKDSVIVELALPKNKSTSFNLSISALPKENIFYQPENSIISSFLIGPYVKGNSTNGYFLESPDRQRRFELDTRLLVEGWGKYDWNSRIFKKIDKPYENEDGISFIGKLFNREPKGENHLYLVNEKIPEMKIVALGRDGIFKGKMTLFKGDSLNAALMGDNGKLRKPKVQFRSSDSLDKEIDIRSWLKGRSLDNRLEAVSSQLVDTSLDIDNRTIVLDEVTVSKKPIRKKVFQFSSEIESVEISDADIRRNKTIRSYLLRLGFSINIIAGNIVVVVPKFGGMGAPNPIVTPIFVEGNYENASEVLNRPLSTVRFLTYSRSRIAPFVSVSLNHDYTPFERRNKFVQFAIENGYTRPNEYFPPNYLGYNSAIFKHFGALDWQANVTVISDRTTSIAIPVRDQEALTLYIEGMASDGQLLSQKETLELKKDQ